MPGSLAASFNTSETFDIAWQQKHSVRFAIRSYGNAETLERMHQLGLTELSAICQQRKHHADLSALTWRRLSANRASLCVRRAVFRARELCRWRAGAHIRQVIERPPSHHRRLSRLDLEHAANASTAENVCKRDKCIPLPRKFR